jgi:hypothetical protein
MIKRADLIKEEILREYIRKRIHEAKQNDPEHKLRMVIREMIKEATDKVPTENTGVNFLENFLDRNIKKIKDAYKMLTTDPEQRVSFIKHLLAFIEDGLDEDKQLDDAAKDADAEEDEELEEAEDVEEVKVIVGNEGEALTDEEDQYLFPDIDKQEAEQAVEDIETGELVTLAGEDVTGRAKAVKIYDEIEKPMTNAYDELTGLDAKMFKKYIAKNIDLHRMEAEKELPNPNEELMTVPAEDL